MGNFDKYVNYTTLDDSSIISMVFGRDLPVMETDLNEMQKLLLDRLVDLVDSLMTTGFTDVSKISINLTNNTMTLGAGCSIKLPNKLLLTNRNALTVPLPSAGTLYLHYKQVLVSEADTLYKDSLEASNNTVTNYIRDSRITSEYGEGIVAHKRYATLIKFSSSPELSGYQTFSVGERSTSNFTILSSFTSSLISTLPASKIIQTELLKLVSNTQIESWNKKVDSSDITTTPVPNKILKLNSNSKMPCDITGNSTTVGGCSVQDTKTTDTNLWSSIKIKAELDKKQGVVLRGTSTPTASLGSIGDIYIQIS